MEAMRQFMLVYPVSISHLYFLLYVVNQFIFLKNWYWKFDIQSQRQFKQYSISKSYKAFCISFSWISQTSLFLSFMVDLFILFEHWETGIDNWYPNRKDNSSNISKSYNALCISFSTFIQKFR